MNWRRGFLRLWAVFAVAWFVFAYFHVNPGRDLYKEAFVTLKSLELRVPLDTTKERARKLVLIGDTMAKRELIDTGSDKRYVRRNKRGQFNESDDVGRSLAVDRRQRAKTKVKSGEGDKGDRPKPKTKRKAGSKCRKKAASRKGAARQSARKKGAKSR